MTFRDVRRGFVLMDTGRKVKNLLAIEQMRNKRSSLGDKFAVNKIDTMKKSFKMGNKYKRKILEKYLLFKNKINLLMGNLLYF